MKRLQTNGLPIDGVFDEISTSDFADSGDTFILKPQDDEILELTGVKMFFDNKLEYKPINVKFIAFDESEIVVEYKKLKDWLTKSNEGVKTDSHSFIGKEIVCYQRTFTEPIYLVAENLQIFIGEGIKLPALKSIEISVEGNQKMTTASGENVEIAKGRYDVMKYLATEQDKAEWSN